MIKFFVIFLLSVFSIFTPKKINLITLIKKSSSGSNVTPIYNRLITDHPNLDINLIEKNYHIDSQINKINIKHLFKWFKMLRSRVIVTTHGPFIRSKFRSKKQVSIDLWHGFPTKKAGLLLGKKNTLVYTDYIISYSDFCTTLQNARFGLPINKYIVLGAPRNDFLFEQPQNPFNTNYKKYLFYAPTWNQSINNNFLDFGLIGFNIEGFNSFLKQNDYLLVWKIHPNDDYDNHLINQENHKLSHIFIVNDQQLSMWNLDFYQLLPLSDLLITDYSSVYADYLLLDKPIIFVDHKSGVSDQNQKLLLNPFEKWMPGPIVNKQNTLQLEVQNCLQDQKYYCEKRERTKHKFHRYCDNSSTERVVDFILKVLEEDKK